MEGEQRVVHSQVRKIKQEDEKMRVHETYQRRAPDMRLVLRDLARRLSRSPLGQVGREISIGGDSL